MTTRKLTAHTTATATTPAPSSIPPHTQRAPQRLSVSVTHLPPQPVNWTARISTGADVLLFGATAILAIFTFKLWRSTGALVQGADGTAKRELRAYVGIDSISLTSLHLYTQNYTLPPQTRIGDRMRDKIDAQMKNFGSSPANHVDFAASVWTNANLPERGELDKILDEIRGKKVPGSFIPRHSIFPGQSAPAHIYISDLTPFRDVLAEKMANVFVFGSIDYSDMFGSRHRTRFCYFFDKVQKPGMEFVPFDRYNEAT